MNYKIISFAEWEAEYKHLYPNARQSIDEKEVVLSCLDGDGDMTQAEALAYIDKNWPKDEVDNG